MWKFAKWSLIVGASAGMLALCPSVGISADPVPSPRAVDAHEVMPLAFPAGFAATGKNPADGIRDDLAKFVDHALTRGDFNKSLGELAKPEREEARAFKGADQSKLDAQIDRINQAWKAKYNQEFKLDAKMVFGAPVEIIEGEVVDPAAALGNWPVAAMGNQPVTASGVQPGDNKEVNKEARKEKLNKGRKVALVRFTPMAGKENLTVSMMHYLPASWVIDVPEGRSGEQIYNDLLTHLTHIADNTDKWPADANEAYRVVSWHVISAFYGVNSAEHGIKG